MDFYFSRFEHRQPPEPLKTPRWVMMTAGVSGRGAHTGRKLYLLALDRLP